MPTITARLEDWLDGEIRRFWSRHGEGPSSGMRRVAREWWTLHNLPHLEFREGPAGRRAGVRGGPDVWEIGLLARELGRDPETLAGHLGGRISGQAITEALEYARRFPDEVEAWLARNDSVASRLGGSRTG